MLLAEGKPQSRVLPKTSAALLCFGCYRQALARFSWSALARVPSALPKPTFRQLKSVTRRRCALTTCVRAIAQAMMPHRLNATAAQNLL